MRALKRNEEPYADVEKQFGEAWKAADYTMTEKALWPTRKPDAGRGSGTTCPPAGRCRNQRRRRLEVFEDLPSNLHGRLVPDRLWPTMPRSRFNQALRSSHTAAEFYCRSQLASLSPILIAMAAAEP